jgi:hypothetical protein
VSRFQSPTAFPNELYQTPRSWVEKAYPNLIHYNKVNKGGHFRLGRADAALQRSLDSVSIAALNFNNRTVPHGAVRFSRSKEMYNA